MALEGDGEVTKVSFLAKVVYFSEKSHVAEIDARVSRDGGRAPSENK